MGTFSFVLSILGMAGACVHYMIDMTAQRTLKFVLGIVTLILVILALVFSLGDMKKQKANGGIKPSMKNMALMGHAAAGVTLVLGGIICALAFAKYPMA